MQAIELREFLDRCIERAITPFDRVVVSIGGKTYDIGNIKFGDHHLIIESGKEQHESQKCHGG